MFNKQSNTWKVLATMSGTSLDGLDIALIRFSKNEHWAFKIEVGETIGYSSDWHNKLRYREQIPESELLQLSQDFGLFLSSQINDFCDEHQINKNEIDLIASHGHTIYHQPELAYTLQIGNGPEIFENTGITTVCDFRVQDVELGGQGAPLVPIGDDLLFREYDACINLGGFSNISFEHNNNRIAFDICAVNYVFNDLASRINLNYDRGGAVARSGNIHHPLLDELNDLAYYKKALPKTLGAEWVNEFIYPLIQKHSALSIADLLRTYTEHCAIQISQNINNNNLQKVLITGGGAYNHFLIEQIKIYSHSSIEIPSDEIIEFKEALIFGFMGLLRMRDEINVLSSVTGAKHDHSSGKIYS